MTGLAARSQSMSDQKESLRIKTVFDSGFQLDGTFPGIVHLGSESGTVRFDAGVLLELPEQVCQQGGIPNGPAGRILRIQSIHQVIRPDHALDHAQWRNGGRGWWHGCDHFGFQSYGRVHGCPQALVVR